jgi:hypothetical protein
MEIGRHLAPGRTLCDQSSAYDRNGGFVAIFAALSDKAKGRAKREEVLEPGSEGKLISKESKISESFGTWQWLRLQGHDWRLGWRVHQPNCMEFAGFRTMAIVPPPAYATT